MSEETPVMITVVSGGESTIDEIEPGIYLVQIQNIIPNVTVLSDNRSVKVPLPYAFPANFSMAAMNLMDNNGEEKTFLVRAVDIRYFEANQSLVCEIIPQEFYNSTPLVPDQTTIHKIIPGYYTWINVSFEYFAPAPENALLQSCCTFEQVDTQKCVPMRPFCGY